MEIQPECGTKGPGPVRIMESIKMKIEKTNCCMHSVVIKTQHVECYSRFSAGTAIKVTVALETSFS